MKKEVIYSELIGQAPQVEEDDVLIDSVYPQINKSPNVLDVMTDSVVDAPKAHPDNVSGKMKVLSE